tara:strand:+ start:275 stop:682 length:408 start_codon:yes stop_codon:yes gene_type:complete
MRLYGFLAPGDVIADPEDKNTIGHWEGILSDPKLRYFLVEAEDLIVSTCTLTLVPNLTRGMRPYGLIENVVTDPKFRKQGLGRKVLKYALDDAWKEGCYKVMLLTGSKRESTLRFYEKTGFKRRIKTGFVAHPID